MNREKGSFDPDLEFHTESDNILHILPEEKEDETPFVLKRASRRTFLKLVAVIMANSLANRASLEKALADGGVDSAFNFKLGFMDLYEALGDKAPEIMGWPLENEHFDPVNGNAVQRTTSGLAVWRKKDNWTAFTNGSRTWVNGPEGVQERGNEERFPWEDRPAVAGIQATPSTLQPTPEPARLPAPKEPEIIGDEQFKRQIQAALDLLKNKDPEHYNSVLKYVVSIRYTPNSPNSNINTLVKRVDINKHTIDAGVAWLASTLTAEARHSQQAADWWNNNPKAISIPKEVFSGKDAEIDSMTQGHEALKLVGGDQSLLDFLKARLDNTRNGTESHWEVTGGK